MENIKKGLEDTILIIKKCLHDDINQYQVFIELGTDAKVLNENIINRLETMNYLQGLINSLDKENELDSAINDAIKEANYVYKPIVNNIATNTQEEEPYPTFGNSPEIENHEFNLFKHWVK